MIQQLGFFSHSVGAALFVVLCLLLMTAWRGRFRGALLACACIVSALWCATLAYVAISGDSTSVPFLVVEGLRDVIWIGFILSVGAGAVGELRSRVRLVWLWTIVLGAALYIVLYAPAQIRSFVPAAYLNEKTSSFVMLLLVLTGLVLVEQLYRNTKEEQRWALKFLCFAVGAMFAYDFFLYAEAFLFNRINPQLWVARGVVNALMVPLIAVSATRNPDWSVEIFVSRHVVFHSATVVGAGCYLLLMSAAGYYIQAFGGSWGGFAQAVFMSAAVVLLLVVVFSGQFRARLRMFISKHFFRNRYDYRDEWLRFTQTLSSQSTQVGLRENVVRAIGEITESPGGVLWLSGTESQLQPVEFWNLPDTGVHEVSIQSGFAKFLATSGWIVSVDDYKDGDSAYEGVQVPDWILSYPGAWAVVPLNHHNALLGFVLLTKPNTPRRLNWEDTDLLKTVGSQAAGYLALLSANDALAESRQFEAFNRLSSFVVHDLKNLVAQLSLVGINAKKHIDNPEFVADAISTVEKATEKMNRLLANLRKTDLDETTSRLVNVGNVLRKVVEMRKSDQPEPKLVLRAQGLIIRADVDRLTSVIEHVVQNAQEATEHTGSVTVCGDRDGENILIEVLDTGRGMDKSFIRERLFKPFDTTKGNAGMGIGVYETREFVVSRGGSVEVNSEPGHGTTFRILLPSEPGIETAIQDFDMETRA